MSGSSTRATRAPIVAHKIPIPERAEPPPIEQSERSVLSVVTGGQRGFEPMTLDKWAASVLELASQDKASGTLGGWSDKEIIERRAQIEAAEGEYTSEQLTSRASKLLGSEGL